MYISENKFKKSLTPMCNIARPCKALPGPWLMLHIPGPFPAELLCMCERCELVLRIDSQYQALMPPRGKKQVAQAFIVQYRYSTRNTIFTFQYTCIAIFVRPLLATRNMTYMHLCFCKSFPKTAPIKKNWKKSKM